MYAEILSFIIRLIAYSSSKISSMKKIFLFSNFLYSFSSIERDNFIINNFNTTDGYYSHVSVFVSKLLQVLESNENLRLLFFSLVDICNAKLLNKFCFYCNRYTHKQEKADTSTNTVKLLYLFNPITVISCISFNLSSVYILLLLVYLTLKPNMGILKYTAFIIAFIVCPQYSVILISFILYEYFNDKICRTQLISILNSLLIIISIAKIGFNINLLSAHIKYYTITDNNPSIGLLWGILNETFLKFKNFSIYSILLYEVMINFSVIYLMILISQPSQSQDKDQSQAPESAKDNENSINSSKVNDSTVASIDSSYFPLIKKSNKSICFMLLYIVYFICARIPSENDQVLTACLVASHYQIFKNVYLNFGVSKL